MFFFRNLVNELHGRGVPVYLISGGFRCIIAPVADQLNIPLWNIFANRLTFYYTGIKKKHFKKLIIK